jgi:superfamily II DNA/RNA helicase
MLKTNLFVFILPCITFSSAFVIGWKVRARTRIKSVNYETFGDAALSDQTFSSHFPSLPSWLSARAEECGWKYPTLIQRRAIEAVLEGNDVIIQSQTGSGKTLAYLLPLLAAIDPSRACIQGIVVVPTRELGVQVARVARRLAAASIDAGSEKLMIMSALQGSTNKRQRAWARSDPPHLVIGTPLELCELVKSGGIKYHAVKFVVVDEVDACLLNNSGTIVSSKSSKSLNVSGSGPLHELLSRYLSPTYEEPTDEMEQLALAVPVSESSRIISHGTDRLTVFVSATIPQHNHFLKQCIQNQWMVREPVYVCASPGELIPPTLKHVYVVCKSPEQKMGGLVRMIAKEMSKTVESSEKSEVNRVLVFCEPKRPLEQMSEILQQQLQSKLKDTHDVTTNVLRYEDSTSTRIAVMEAFCGSKTYLGGRIMDEDIYNDGIDDLETNTDKDTVINSIQSESGLTKRRELQILLSSDLPARGLDIADISHVINFDLCEGDTYVHRGGRAGRLGRKGLVMSLITSDQEFVLERLANKLGLNIQCIARQQSKK